MINGTNELKKELSELVQDCPSIRRWIACQRFSERRVEEINAWWCIGRAFHFFRTVRCEGRQVKLDFAFLFDFVRAIVLVIAEIVKIIVGLLAAWLGGCSTQTATQSASQKNRSQSLYSKLNQHLNFLFHKLGTKSHFKRLLSRNIKKSIWRGLQKISKALR